MPTRNKLPVTKLLEINCPLLVTQQQCTMASRPYGPVGPWLDLKPGKAKALGFKAEAVTIAVVHHKIFSG